ncbi:MAG TPA: phosphoribosylaminoimidazolesuccinocarboxamide synthase [Ktedonobacterales bacterium]|nr:phosphoribosylaminoimidazolesuccinocarboxamide synthase [Ktedonobacterales bacterium]
MNKGEMIYEGKAKKVYTTGDPDLVIVEYKDDATAFNGEKRGTISGKGEMNNRMTVIFFEMLGAQGIPTHYVERLSEREQLVKRVRIVPIEVVVRNIAAGSLSKRLGLPEGQELPRPIVELYYKDDALGDPLINDDHIAILGLATPEQLATMRTYALAINDILRAHLAGRNVLLVDFKLEFGTDGAGKLLLADEISPDTCRFWDAETREKLDKDRFRRDMGGVEEAYQEMLRRLGGAA